MEQKCEPMNKNRIQGTDAGRAGMEQRSPYPSRAGSVYSAVVHGRWLNLPREICAVSRNPGLLRCGNRMTAAQKSAEGIVPDS